MIAAAAIERMSLTERLQTMELLWSSISRTPEKVTSPEWHREILSVRRQRIESGKAKFLTIAELKKRLRRSKA